MVFHQGAVPSVPRSVAEPLRTHEVNASGTLRVLEAARHAGVRRVVYAASSSAYGDTPVLPKVETMPANPRSPYALQKWAGETYCRLYTELYGLETVALRYFNVYGPRQNPESEYAAVVPRFAVACLRGEPPVVYGDGEQTRDFTFVEDAVRANLLAAEAPRRRGRRWSTWRAAGASPCNRAARGDRGAVRRRARAAPRAGAGGRRARQPGRPRPRAGAARLRAPRHASRGPDAHHREPAQERRGKGGR